MHKKRIHFSRVRFHIVLSCADKQFDYSDKSD